MRNIKNTDLWRSLHSTARCDLAVRRLYERICEDDTLDLRRLLVEALDDPKKCWWLEFLIERFTLTDDWKAYCAKRAEIFHWKERACQYHWHAYWDKHLISESDYHKLLASTSAYYNGRFRTYILTELLKD